MTDKEQIIVDGESENCKILFRCKHINDLKAYDMIRNGIKITPENAPVDDFDLMLIENTDSPFGFSSVCKRNSKENVWEYSGFGHSGACSIVTALLKQLARKTQECEELKIKLIQKDEVNMFFNTPIEGWDNDPCGICPHKAENEELKKEIINKNEKIKELRFSVSDLTNRLCYLNAEKSFRIVDLEQTLDGIEKELKEDIYCENQECGCDDFEECLKCTKEHILDIINKAKGEGNGR